MDLASNMGNFKGVMLCNRPAQGGATPAKSFASGGADSDLASKPAFISTVTKDEQLGLNPVKVERVAVAVKHKNKSDDVTWRHKKWLAEFQQRKNEIADMMEEKQVEVLDAKQRFADRAAAQRQAVRMARDVDPENDELLATAIIGGLREEDLQAAEEKVAERTQAMQVAVPEEKTMKLSEANLKKHAQKTKKKQKPKWAMTEDENEDAEELEVDDLLDFAENLDYEQYIDDMEVKEALTFVKNRVTDLAAGAPKEVEKEGEESGEGEEECEDGEAKNGVPRVRPTWKKKENQWENGSQASVGSNVSEKSILEGGGLKGVHSSASVRAMMAKESQKLGAIKEQTVDLSRPEPVVSTIKQHSTVGKTDASNLPYLYRHPAV